MAEIKIEQKKPIWPWVLLGLFIVAVLVYFLVFYDNSNNYNNNTGAATERDSISYTNQANEHSRTGEREKTGNVAAYVNFVEDNRGNMGLDHEYTHEALLKLSAATRAVANQVGYDVRADLEKVEEHAKTITDDRYETTHADSIRNAVDILTNVLQNIQNAEFPRLADDASALRSASESIRSGTHTLEQKEAIKNYFAKASDLLQKMNG